VTGITFHRNKIANVQLKVIHVFIKLLSATFKTNFHNIERPMPFGKCHIRKPIVNIEFIASTRSASAITFAPGRGSIFCGGG
jgi:hypothetical protein